MNRDPTNPGGSICPINIEDEKFPPGIYRLAGHAKSETETTASTRLPPLRRNRRKVDVTAPHPRRPRDRAHAVTAPRPRFAVPHPLVLLTVCVGLAAVASHLLPAGEYERRLDEESGQNVVVPGTYHEVEPNPVGPFEAVVALPRGIAEGISVIALVFLIGGAFTVVDETGALKRGVTSLVRALRGRDLLVIPLVSVLFATGAWSRTCRRRSSR